MLISLECANCHTVNVAELSLKIGFNQHVAYVEDVHVINVKKLEEFLDKYDSLLDDLMNHVEFPIHKDSLIKRIRRFFRCNEFLAHELVDRIKADLGLWEDRGGWIREV